jgi:hypothetical protein
VNTLQEVLTTLGSQKLSPGYLTPAGTGTAHDTLRALKQGFDPYTLISNPIARPALLFTPAWVRSIAVGQDAIFLDGVDGNLDLSHAQGPAYLFTEPV